MAFAAAAAAAIPSALTPIDDYDSSVFGDLNWLGDQLNALFDYWLWDGGATPPAAVPLPHASPMVHVGAMPPPSAPAASFAALAEPIIKVALELQDMEGRVLSIRKVYSVQPGTTVGLLKQMVSSDFRLGAVAHHFFVYDFLSLFIVGFARSCGMDQAFFPRVDELDLHGFPSRLQSQGWHPP
jgi:hypothetical protein